MEIEKKDWAIIILAVALAASGFGNIINGINPYYPIRPLWSEKITLRVGYREADMPLVLDPVDSRDSESNNMIRHVCDNLWYYDLYDPDFALEMRLAAEYPTWDATQTNLTVILRENIFFHDGTPFDAEAVKFTFDRIMYFINWSGNLPGTTHVCSPASLFFNMRGDPILNRTVINDDYNVTFVLNKPNGVFIPLLSYDACAILSPEATPATEYLELGIDILVGTGPFFYTHFILGEELKFTRSRIYWGPTTMWDQIIWVFYPDIITAGNALLGGEVHRGTFSSSMIPYIQADPDLIFVNMNTSTTYRYWGINNRKINNSLIRKGIAYAYNYTYYIDEIRQGFMIRANQFLPPGFPYYNATFSAPYQNTSIARQAMMEAFPVVTAATGCTNETVGVNSANDAAWAGLELASYKILQHEGWNTGIEMNTAFTNDLDKIGITLTPDIMDWDTYINVSTYNEDRLELYYAGWIPDYLDPFSMIEPLLNNKSSENHIQLQDAEIMQWLEDYEKTNLDNTTERANLLWKIQNRAINELFVELPLCYDMAMYAHHNSLGNVCYNIKGDLWDRDDYLIPGVSSI